MDIKQFEEAKEEIRRHEKVLKDFSELEYGLNQVLGKDNQRYGYNVSGDVPDECEQLLAITTAMVEKWRTNEIKRHNEIMKAI